MDLVIPLTVFGIIIVTCIGLCKVYIKAGKEAWAPFVPIYGNIVLLDIADMSAWWLVGCIVPYINFVMAPLMLIISGMKIADNFGQSKAFGIGLIICPFIFYPVLGFGKSYYKGIMNEGDIANELEIDKMVEAELSQQLTSVAGVTHRPVIKDNSNANTYIPTASPNLSSPISDVPIEKTEIKAVENVVPDGLKRCVDCGTISMMFNQKTCAKCGTQL